jgi:predicted nuclease of predicted toxin-antitoxin system
MISAAWVKALLDEQLSPRIAELLRNRGHDIQAVVERSDLAGRSDPVIFEVAAGEERAVITNNGKDFRPIATERLARDEPNAGLILLPSTRTRTRSAVEMLVDAIDRILSEHPDGLAASETWIPPLTSG